MVKTREEALVRCTAAMHSHCRPCLFLRQILRFSPPFSLQPPMSSRQSVRLTPSPILLMWPQPLREWWPMSTSTTGRGTGGWLACALQVRRETVPQPSELPLRILPVCRRLTAPLLGIWTCWFRCRCLLKLALAPTRSVPPTSTLLLCCAAE